MYDVQKRAPAAYVYVEDPDALFAEYEQAGADIVEPVASRAYGMRDFVVRDPWLCMRYEIAQMRKQEGGGAIVNMASNVGAHQRLPGMGAYAATKAGVSTLTRGAARDHAHEGVRINAVSPGPIATPMSLLPGETDADRADRLRTQIPAGRVGATEEVAAAVLWLASAESGFTVGHDLVLDGGASA